MSCITQVVEYTSQLKAMLDKLQVRLSPILNNKRCSCLSSEIFTHTSYTLISFIITNNIMHYTTHISSTCMVYSQCFSTQQTLT